MSTMSVVNPMSRAGTVVWADFGTTQGREQSGQRPALIIASTDFEDVVQELTILLPCTRKNRDWKNHILLTGQTGLDTPTFAMTEQPRTISTARIQRVLGRVDANCLATISRWTHLWMHEPAKAH